MNTDKRTLLFLRLRGTGVQAKGAQKTVTVLNIEYHAGHARRGGSAMERTHLDHGGHVCDATSFRLRLSSSSDPHRLHRSTCSVPSSCRVLTKPRQHSRLRFAGEVYSTVVRLTGRLTRRKAVNGYAPFDAHDVFRFRALNVRGRDVAASGEHVEVHGGGARFGSAFALLGLGRVAGTSLPSKARNRVRQSDSAWIPGRAGSFVQHQNPRSSRGSVFVPYAR